MILGNCGNIFVQPITSYISSKINKNTISFNYKVPLLIYKFFSDKKIFMENAPKALLKNMGVRELELLSIARITKKIDIGLAKPLS